MTPELPCARSAHQARRRRRALLAWLAAAAAAPVLAAAPAADPHAGHAGAAGSGLKRTEVLLQPAAVRVLSQDGKSVDFRQALDDGRPVMLNFLFTSCTAICPVTAQVFSEARSRLGDQRDLVHVVSVSIDPEYDTPQRLAEYARRFSPGGNWTFFTASQKDSAAIQTSFNAYQGDKMNHLPVTFLRAAPGKPWVRLDGFASPGILVAEIRALMPQLASAAPVVPRP
jgi:protein SCO1/2